MTKTTKKIKDVDIENNVINVDIENDITSVDIEKIKPLKTTSKKQEITKPVIKNLSLKDAFLKNISKPNFTIYQNSKLIYVYNENTIIKTTDKYFEINDKKYTYFGIEIKYA